MRQVFPDTRKQRCWFHRIGNELNALPKSAQPGAKAALAEDKEHAEALARAFAKEYGTKWPKAVAKITEDLDVLLASFDYPAEHWVHLRTTSPIETTFATVRLRQRVNRGPARAPPASRWSTSSSNPRTPDGTRSTRPTWSPWSEPEPSSRRANRRTNRRTSRRAKR